MQEQCRLITKEQLDYYKGLENKLDVAIEALKWLDRHSSKYDCSWSIEEQLDNIKAQAQAAIYQIEELDK